MPNIAERGTNQPREQGRIDKVLHSPMSRRTFIKRAGAVLLSAEIAAACGVPAGIPQTSASPARTEAASSIGTFPSSESTPATIPTLSSDTFNKVFGYYTDTTEVNIGGNQETVQSLASEASNIWNDGNLTSISIGRNSVEGLMFALSASELAGNTGTVDFSKIFKGLNIELPRFSISTLTNGKDTEEASNVSPESLTLRKGMDMTVVGIDDTKGNAIVAFSDSLRKPDNSPTMYFASIPVEASSSQLSFTELLARNGATYDSKTHEILYTNGKTLPIYKLDPTLSQSLEQETGSYFLDIDPLRTKAQGKTVYETSPVIPTPDTTLVPEGSKIEQSSDGRILAFNSKGTAIARAADLGGEWKWVGPDKAAGLNYFFRELADGLGIKIGTAPDGSHFEDNNGEFLDIVGNYFNLMELAFGWSQLNPNKNAFSLDYMKSMAGAATQNNMEIYAGLMGSGDIPSWIMEGGYSPEQIKAYAKECVQTVIKEVNNVNIWNVFNEPVSAPMYGATPPEHFLANRLGSDYDNFIGELLGVAREANPSAKLIINEQYNDGRSREISNGFYNLVKQLKGSGVPLDGIGMEMHLHYQDGGADVPPSPQLFAEWVKKYEDLGLDVYVTEFDVDMTRYSGSKAQEQAVQAQWYKNYLQAALDSGVKNFYIFGLTDTTSWYNLIGQPHADALFLNGNYSPKPAFTAIEQVLEGQYKKGA